jgi:hypothetical protein
MSNSISGHSSASADVATNKLLVELKTRARIRLNALSRGDPIVIDYAGWISKKRSWPLPPEWKLQHAFNLVATEIGFHDWQHARRVLSGIARLGDDMGAFWYDTRAAALFNHWYAKYEDAREYQAQSGHWLFPFGKQFVVGDANYVRTLRLDPASELWTAVQHDVVATYGSESWRALCAARLNATRDQPPPTANQTHHKD